VCVASARKGSPLLQRTIGLCLGLAALIALASAALVAGGGLPAAGTARTTGPEASSRVELAASVTALERRVEGQARRLGIRVPARRALPRSEGNLARRAAELEHVVAFLRGRRELAPSLERPSVAASAARDTPLQRIFRRAARESVRLGIAPPPPPRASAEAAELSAQTETWRDVGAWLARRSEDRRPAEVNASAAAVAMEYRGTPYVYGGASPSGFDCSGLVSFAFARVGTTVPHNTNAIWGAFPKVPRKDLRVGDLVFFSGLGHVGIYVGRGRYVHSPHSGDVVRVEPLASRDDYVGAVRA
jgi:cell wall-associated NlpC family hydrolase